MISFPTSIRNEVSNKQHLWAPVESSAHPQLRLHLKHLLSYIFQIISISIMVFTISLLKITSPLYFHADYFFEKIPYVQPIFTLLWSLEPSEERPGEVLRQSGLRVKYHFVTMINVMVKNEIIHFRSRFQTFSIKDILPTGSPKMSPVGTR